MPADRKGGFTRGKGLLEPYLARRRASKANHLIPPGLRGGRILDLGCGSYPYFLAHTAFKDKFAIDQLPPSMGEEGIRWHTLDLNKDPSLPFEQAFFDVVTMLAVAEHLDPASLERLLVEVYRTLKPGGRVIITTPAARADGLLRRMARLGLVSAEEINEHTFAYTLPLLGWYFGRAGFGMQLVQFGYFEWGLNMWATADR
ncbi:MAG TPA: methyltransferase domain-containing protein [Anaerolineales bacterium]|nr:methyltransferase domain-containing protein [Anaerolineales bacterium]